MMLQDREGPALLEEDQVGTQLARHQGCVVSTWPNVPCNHQLPDQGVLPLRPNWVYCVCLA